MYNIHEYEGTDSDNWLPNGHTQKEKRKDRQTHRSTYRGGAHLKKYRNLAKIVCYVFNSFCFFLFL